MTPRKDDGLKVVASSDDIAWVSRHTNTAHGVQPAFKFNKGVNMTRIEIVLSILVLTLSLVLIFDNKLENDEYALNVSELNYD